MPKNDPKYPSSAGSSSAKDKRRNAEVRKKSVDEQSRARLKELLEKAGCGQPPLPGDELET